MDWGSQPVTLQRPPLGLAEVDGGDMFHPHQFVHQSTCSPWARSRLDTPSGHTLSCLSAPFLRGNSLGAFLISLSVERVLALFPCDQKLNAQNWACVFAFKWHFSYLLGKKANAYQIQEMVTKALLVRCQVQRTQFLPFWRQARMDGSSHRKSRGLKTSFGFGSLPCFLSTSLLIHPGVLAEVGKLLKLDF